MAFLPKSLFTHLGLSDMLTARMPARVVELVVAEEERSERLIGWVQLTIAVTFATLYAVAPRPTDASTMFQPVPIVLAAYIAFTILRLAAAYRGFLPGWLLVASMVADIALLYGLIWSFHIAYHQPAAFYLKVPTFAYVFVFIAVRALRFDPRFVVSQGIIAAIGWVIMVLYAIENSGGDVITRSFVAYLTSNLVLIGAEFDKIFTILVMSGVLGLALFRARRTLLTAARDAAATRDMRRYFGAGVADAITSRETEAMAGEAEGRDAAILMLDLRNFSHFAATHTPHDVVATLTAYHALVVPIIEREGGIVDKFLGDGVMATFGAVSPSETAAADALRALSAIMAGAPAWSAAMAAKGMPALAIQGAAVAGRVVAATLGNKERLEFTVIGSAANIAAKLEKHNKVAGTAALTTEETLDRAKAQGFDGTLSSLGLCKVAGADDPLHLWKLC
ncbi:adenylate/guanylate cyclase domain-containing protein [Acuticoccus kandeliae]|uniref:adenylate/guanylate cyclase domain-containing protein n=1 Tax=Acuticoccus kandeliae TaxID=2073160 RepID=UPI000D3E074F|nr:adenylate/guanylate cyclase domain-containing protein [Acuticoccus kandeliae]